MNRVPRHPDEYDRLFEEQLQFLSASAAAYDAGFPGEFKRLALTIRVLVYDTRHSKSLLGQMGVKEDLSFWDMSLPYDPRNKLSHSGLIRLGLGGSAGAEGAVPLPLFDDCPVPPIRVGFEEWWGGVVFVDQDGTQFTRRDIVLTAANQEGGGHVDPALDADYARLSRENSLGWFDKVAGREFPSRDQVPAAVRHMAYEVLRTVCPENTERPADPKGFGTIAMGAMMTEGSFPPPIPERNTVKVGRNSPCPCGSGKKYKKCCLP